MAYLKVEAAKVLPGLKPVLTAGAPVSPAAAQAAKLRLPDGFHGWQNCRIRFDDRR